MNPMALLHRRPACRRRSFALLLSLLLIGLVMAITAELVTATSTASVVSARRARTLAHDLAVDGAMLVLADRLGDDENNPWIAALDANGVVTRIDFAIGEVVVTCAVRDDGARFNPLQFQDDPQRPRLERKLALLATKLSLPPARVELRPIVTERARPAAVRYRSYDQLLDDLEPESIFRWDERVDSERGKLAWSDVVTLWGDGRIDLWRANEPVLEAVLEDIRPGLGRAMLATRSVKPSQDLLAAALTRVDAEIRQEVAARVTYDARRYALRIDTTIHADRRRWFIVATIHEGRVKVLHRSQLTW